MKRFKKTIVSCMLLSSFIFALICCGNSPAGAEKLRILNSYKCASIDPAQNGSHWLFDWAAADTFMKITEEGKLEPNVLRSLEQLDDLNWKLVVRDNVFFQNGKKCDARAAAQAIERQLRKSKKTKLILGDSTVKVTGPLELVLTTSEPNSSVPRALAARNAGLFVYDTEIMENAGDDVSRIIGAGAFTAPYEIVEYNPEYFRLKRNKNYWAGTPALEEIEIRVVPDEQARIKAIQNGEADLAFYPPFEAAYTLKNRKDAFFIVSDKALQSLLVYINLRTSPFDDVKVRQAFSHGIDYRQIAEDVSEGIFVEAKGIYPFDSEYTVQNQRYDPEEAKRLLDESGWREGKDGVRRKDGVPLTVSLILSPRGPEVKTVCIAIQSQLKKIGMDVKLNINEDARGYLKSHQDAWNCTIGLTGSLSGTGDYIQPFVRRFTSSGDWNFGGIDNSRIDTIGRELQGTFAIEEQYRLLGEAQHILVEQQTCILSSTFKRFMVVASPEWQDYHVSSYRRHITWQTKS